MAFKDIPFLLEKYANYDMKFLDYGCGTGRSLRFIRSLGYNDIVGVDISQDMLNEAKKIDPLGKYKLIENSQIPYENNTFDVVFMSYVFLEVAEFDTIHIPMGQDGEPYEWLSEKSVPYNYIFILNK